jgi:hypothetical protein
MANTGEDDNCTKCNGLRYELEVTKRKLQNALRTPGNDELEATKRKLEGALRGLAHAEASKAASEWREAKAIDNIEEPKRIYMASLRRIEQDYARKTMITIPLRDALLIAKDKLEQAQREYDDSRVDQYDRDELLAAKKKAQREYEDSVSRLVGNITGSVL